MEDKPTTPQYSLSDLLAYRDAEPLDEEIWRSIANDPHAQQQLARLGELKTQLKNLPPVVPEPALWTNILQRAQPSSAEVPLASNSSNLDQPRQAQQAGIRDIQTARSRARSERPPVGTSIFRLATAAGVFAVAVMGSMLWFNNPDGGLGGGANQRPLDVTVQAAPGLEHWLDRSRQLEAVLASDESQPLAGDPSQRALLYRIADLDAELSSLQQQPMAPELKERLWRQRVGLLETLTEIQRYQMLEENNADAL